ncbi:MarR family winged helix-turn-helix transcriptional regulator [Fundicoccus culcitae]|uniref:MarR family transcriptional regulator n=1 Tax=Fundicoccus culcitae TaxID=2969821 RepID=A0ABY5P2L4_9LACT|nr:MarR family transcriptional regulator [Fundicoccus culcitae]UUX32972.1 MarR family transcriptional regulator [Fundicoccus culcitae]
MKYEEYGEQIQQMNHKMHNLRVKYYDLIKEMPHSEYVILHRLEKIKDESVALNVTQLAKELKLTAPAISRTVKALVDKEWVVRTEDADDRRASYLSLTPKGEQEYGKMKRKLMDFMLQVYQRIQDKDLEHYIMVGNQIIDAMQDIYQDSLSQSNESLEGVRE